MDEKSLERIIEALAEAEKSLRWCQSQMIDVWNHLSPNSSNDMEWADEVIIAIEQKVQAALASQQPQGVPEDVQRTDCNFLFNLIKECRSHVRRTGIKGDDYGLCHESRTLALRYEQGDFEKAMELCRTLAAAPSPDAQS